MGIEIERKFLVNGEFPEDNYEDIKQGYVLCDNSQTVFVDGKYLYFVKESDVIAVVFIDNDKILDDISHKDGHLILDNKNVVRVRIHGENGLITVKGPTFGMITPEYNYPINLNVAQRLLSTMTKSFISKTRFKVIASDGHVWEIDRFSNPPDILLAEIELKSESETFELPSWAGQEVTGDPSYYNSNIIIMLQ